MSDRVVTRTALAFALGLATVFVVGLRHGGRPTAYAAAFAVTTTADAGPGSLRQAMLDANSHAGSDFITFSISPGGLQTIALLSTLPSVTDPAIIDATTQPGYAGAPIIELNGTGAGALANGFLITAGNTTVKGFVVNRFGGNGLELAGKAGQRRFRKLHWRERCWHGTTCQ